MSYKKLMLATAGMMALAGDGMSFSRIRNTPLKYPTRRKKRSPKPQLGVADIPKGHSIYGHHFIYKKDDCDIMVKVEVTGGTAKSARKAAHKLYLQLEVYIGSTPLDELELDNDFMIV